MTVEVVLGERDADTDLGSGFPEEAGDWFDKAASVLISFLESTMPGLPELFKSSARPPSNFVGCRLIWRSSLMAPVGFRIWLSVLVPCAGETLRTSEFDLASTIGALFDKCIGACLRGMSSRSEIEMASVGGDSFLEFRAKNVGESA